MDMSGMAQFMGPGLGGIMAGTEQRQKEDQSYATTQNTLQQILASQGQEVRANDENARKAALHPEELKSKQLANEKLTEEQKHAMLTRYVEANLHYGNFPGADETIMQEFPKLQNHPIRKAMQEARAKDAARLPGQEGPTEVEKLQQRISQMDPKSRDAAAAREHQAALAKTAQDAAATRAREHDERITARQLQLKKMEVESKMQVAEMRAREVAKKLPNMGQYMVSLLTELNQIRGATGMDETTRVERMDSIQRQIDYQYTLMNQGGVERATAGKVDPNAAAGVPTHPTVVTPPPNPSNTAPAAAAAPPPELAKYFTGATKYDPNMQYREVPDGKGGMKLQAQPKK